MGAVEILLIQMGQLGEQMPLRMVIQMGQLMEQMPLLMVIQMGQLMEQMPLSLRKPKAVCPAEISEMRSSTTQKEFL